MEDLESLLNDLGHYYFNEPCSQPEISLNFLVLEFSFFVCKVWTNSANIIISGVKKRKDKECRNAASAHVDTKSKKAS